MEKQNDFERRMDRINSSIHTLTDEVMLLKEEIRTLEKEKNIHEHMYRQVDGRYDILRRQHSFLNNNIKELYLNSTNEIWYRIFINDHFFDNKEPKYGTFIVQINNGAFDEEMSQTKYDINHHRLCIDYFNITKSTHTDDEDLHTLYETFDYTPITSGRFFVYGNIIIFYDGDFENYTVQQLALKLFPGKTVGCYSGKFGYGTKTADFNAAKMEAMEALTTGKYSYQDFAKPSIGADFDIDKEKHPNVPF